MNGQSFTLKPFALPHPLRRLEISGAIARQGHTLALHYALRGPLAEVALPRPADRPARRRGLWEDTCFEFFLAVKNAPGYWEFNLSPAGHWNVYRFTGYRQGMAEEPAFTALPFSLRREPDSVALALEVKTGLLVQAEVALEVAIAAVLRHRGGRMTYWALTHGGPKPDFHRRDAFNLAL